MFLSIRLAPRRIKSAHASLHDDPPATVDPALRQALVLRYGLGGSHWWSLSRD